MDRVGARIGGGQTSSEVSIGMAVLCCPTARPISKRQKTVAKVASGRNRLFIFVYLSGKGLKHQKQ